MTHIFITGASGFVGGAAARHLITKGHKVSAMSRSEKSDAAIRALGAMPVGLAVMRRLNLRYGETPRALLGITIAASLFQDTANAVLLTIAFRWLGRRTRPGGRGRALGRPAS